MIERGKNKKNTQQPEIRTFGDSMVFTARKDSGTSAHKIMSELDDLDMITISAMAIMLSDNRAKAASPYLDGMVKADINTMLLSFLKDTYSAADMGQINSLFSNKYYRRKINRYLKRVVVFVRRGISDSLPRKGMWLLKRMSVSSKQTKAYIDKICETIGSFESVKYIPALSGQTETSGSKRNYKLDHLSDNYKDALIYLVDVLLTCTCIAKMLFVERKIRGLSADSEFVKIIVNMVSTIDDHNLIINKSRPVYKQYYQGELGYINGDDLLYGMAVTIMVNIIKKTEIKDKDILRLDYKPKGISDLRENMRQWLDILAKYDYAADIGALILQRVTLLIKDNYDLLLDALGELSGWENFYKQRVDYHIRERDKERYLKGDFNKEILELSKIVQERSKTNLLPGATEQ